MMKEIFWLLLFPLVYSLNSSVSVPKTTPTPLQNLVITLTAAQPTYTFAYNADHRDYRTLTVTAQKSYTLDLFVIYGMVYTKGCNLYDSATTENFVSALNDLPFPLEDYIPQNYASKSGSLTILLRDASYPNYTCYFNGIFFRLREIHAANCASKNNVYSLANRKLTTTATSSGSCMVTAFSPYSDGTNVSIVSASVSPKKDEYEFISDTNRNIPYLKFSGESANLWSDLYIYDTVFSFIIPPAQNLTFMYMESKNEYYTYLSNKGIFMSRCYAKPQSCQTGYFSINFITSEDVNVVVKDLVLNKNNSIFYFVSDNQEIRITHVGQIVTIKDNPILVMKANDYNNLGKALFEFEVLSSIDPEDNTENPLNPTTHKSDQNACKTATFNNIIFFCVSLFYILW